MGREAQGTRGQPPIPHLWAANTPKSQETSICLFWSSAPLRCPWWMLLCAWRTGCTQMVPSSQPPVPAPLPLVTHLVSEVRKEITSATKSAWRCWTCPPTTAPISGTRGRTPGHDASALLAQGTALLPAPRGISQPCHSPNAPLRPPAWRERGHTACPVTLSPTTPPALPARPVLKIHTNQSSVSVSSSPMPRGSARLPTTCPRATRPPWTRMQCHTPKSTPPPKRSSRTCGQHWPSCGHMDSMWTAHFLQRKLAQSRDLVAVDTPRLWGGETEA